MATFHCNCGTKIAVPDAWAGRRVKCPKCGSAVLVPGGPAKQGQAGSAGGAGSLGGSDDLLLEAITSLDSRTSHPEPEAEIDWSDHWAKHRGVPWKMVVLLVIVAVVCVVAVMHIIKTLRGGEPQGQSAAQVEHVVSMAGVPGASSRPVPFHVQFRAAPVDAGRSQGRSVHFGQRIFSSPHGHSPMNHRTFAALAFLAAHLFAGGQTADADTPAQDSPITHSFLATGGQTYIIEYSDDAAKTDAKPTSEGAKDDVVFEDFEKEKYDGWTSEGTAFGDGPIEIAKLPAYQGNVQGQGKRVVNTHNTRPGGDVSKGDAHTGTLTSKEFTITHRYIRLLIGGGNHVGKTCVNVLIDGKPALSATGKNSNAMATHYFDMKDFAGKKAQIQIVDQVAGGWGNIGVDHIVFTNAFVDPNARIDGGKIVWRSPRNSRDGWVLENGNVLLAVGKSGDLPGGGVIEVTRDGKETVRYKGTQSEVDTVQPLKDGGIILTEAGANPRLLELDKDGKVVVEFKLKTQTQNHHMQQRMSRKLANGNYLVPHLLDKAVREYNAKGEIVWECPTPNWAFTAIRLENGNTLVGCTYGKTVVEFDKDKKIVWQLEPKDVEGVSALNDCCGVQRLPNGNTVVCDYGAGGKGGPKMIEVTREKKVVWKFEDKSNAGIHHVQILDTNGKALEGAPMR